MELSEALRSTFVPPEGSENPVLYIVGEAPAYEEVRQKRPFVGQTGSVLRSAMERVHVTTQVVRISNAFPFQLTNQDGTNRNPTAEEIHSVSEILQLDIAQTKPKRILCLGKSAVEGLFPGHGMAMATAIEKSMSFNGIPVSAYYHPSYIHRNGGVQSKLFIELSELLVRLTNPSPLKLPDTVVTITGRDEQRAFLQTLIQNQIKISLDFESNGIEHTEDGFELLGAGICPVGSDLPVYLPMSIVSMVQDADLWTALVTTCETLVFNMTFEALVLARVLKLSVHDLTLVDVRQYAMVKGDLGGLKPLCVRRLGVPLWDEVVVSVSAAVKKIITALRPTSKLKRAETEALETGGLDGVRAAIAAAKEKTERLSLLQSGIEYLCTLDCRSETELQTFLLKDTETEPRDAYYHYAPLSDLALYCGRDAWATVKLAEYYDTQFTSELERKSARDYYQCHAKLSAIMEGYGLAWDDTKADALASEYQRLLMQTTKSLLLNPVFVAANGLTLHRQIQIASTMDMDVLKSIFNPNSSVETAPFYKSVWTQRMILCRCLSVLIDQYTNGSLQTRHPVYNTVALIASVLKPERKAILASIAGEKFFQTLFIAACSSQVSLMHPVSLDSEHVERLYSALVLAGNDPDADPSAWDLEFRLVMDLKRAKKVSKVLSTYINGSLGKESVRRVVTSELDRPCPVRFSKLPRQVPTTALLQLSFNNNGAETRRWKSGFHTIPPDSELRDIHTHRWEDGLLIHADYSQQEVRVVAFLAGEETLLRAFRENPDMDVHRFVASKIYRKDPKDVTSHERRVAKTVTFGILYGSGTRSIAEAHFNGNVAEAEGVFLAMFQAFPKLKAYIDHQHDLVHRERAIKTLWGGSIAIEYDPNDPKTVAEAELYSQNWPVQNAASDLAGLGLYRFSKAMYSQGFKMAVYGFTHDSGDFEIHGKDLLPALVTAHQTMETGLDTEFGIPVAQEYQIGRSGNKLVTLELHEVSLTKLSADFKGTAEAVRDVTDFLKSSFGEQCKTSLSDKVEVKHRSHAELFAQKMAFSSEIGTDVTTQSGTLEITLS